MLKSHLVQRIAELNPHLYERRLEMVMTTILEEISSAMARGHRVELRGFGAFNVRSRAARLGRDPRTGAIIPVKEKRVPYFKAGKEIRERLNNKTDALEFSEPNGHSP